MIAVEFGVECSFQIVPDLLSEDSETYGGNPGLKLPNFVTSDGVVFGSLNSARAIAALSAKPLRMVWPEDVPVGVAANALEMTLQGMSSEVSLLMVRRGVGEGSPYAGKLEKAVLGMVGWLEANLSAAIAALPERDLSYLEVSLFCFLEHLEFREVMKLDRHPQLRAFRDTFGKRSSAVATQYRFDS
jgi:hypothetical protein